MPKYQFDINVKNLTEWKIGFDYARAPGRIAREVVQDNFRQIGIRMLDQMSDWFAPGTVWYYRGGMTTGFKDPNAMALFIRTDGDAQLDLHDATYYGKFIRQPTGARGWVPAVYEWALRKVAHGDDEIAKKVANKIAQYGVGYSKASPLWKDAYPPGGFGFDYVAKAMDENDQEIKDMVTRMTVITKMMIESGFP